MGKNCPPALSNPKLLFFTAAITATLEFSPYTSSIPQTTPIFIRLNNPLLAGTKEKVAVQKLGLTNYTTTKLSGESQGGVLIR
jgi:hypothetical protein